jgi:RNA polymerase sigma-70 factor (ECF subfamily)
MTSARQALESLFTTRRSALVWRLFRMVSCRDTAEDLAQETYIRVARAVDQGRVEHLPSFLFQTGRNLALDHLRHERRGDRLLDRSNFEDQVRTLASPTPSPEQTTSDRQSVELLFQALQELPERTRRIFYLARVEGVSYPEIARQMGISESTVYKDMRLALARCLMAIEEK